MRRHPAPGWVGLRLKVSHGCACAVLHRAFSLSFSFFARSRGPCGAMLSFRCETFRLSLFDVGGVSCWLRCRAAANGIALRSIRLYFCSFRGIHKWTQQEGICLERPGASSTCIVSAPQVARRSLMRSWSFTENTVEYITFTPAVARGVPRATAVSSTSCVIRNSCAARGVDHTSRVIRYSCSGRGGPTTFAASLNCCFVEATDNTYIDRIATYNILCMSSGTTKKSSRRFCVYQFEWHVHLRDDRVRCCCTSSAVVDHSKPLPPTSWTRKHIIWFDPPRT